MRNPGKKRISADVKRAIREMRKLRRLNVLGSKLTIRRLVDCGRRY